MLHVGLELCCTRRWFTAGTTAKGEKWLSIGKGKRKRVGEKVYMQAVVVERRRSRLHGPLEIPTLRPRLFVWTMNLGRGRAAITLWCGACASCSVLCALSALCSVLCAASLRLSPSSPLSSSLLLIAGLTDWPLPTASLPLESPRLGSAGTDPRWPLRCLLRASWVNALWLGALLQAAAAHSL